MAFGKGSRSSRCSADRASSRRIDDGPVREVSRPRGEAGAQAEPYLFVAPAGTAAIAEATPAVAVTAIADRIIISRPRSWIPSPPELLARHKRSRLSNGLPVSGEGRR